MGDMADYYMESCWAYDEFDELYEPEVASYQWKTKDGRILEISKMETEHLMNVKAYLERHHRCDLLQYSHVCEELEMRRSGA